MRVFDSLEEFNMNDNYDQEQDSFVDRRYEDQLV
jgi:hypothetical protein